MTKVFVILAQQAKLDEEVMTESGNNKIIRSSDWMALQLRLTAFPSEPIELPRGGWWLELVGEEPDVQTYKKVLQIEEIGPYGKGRLLLTANPVRIDWHLLPAEIELTDEIPSIGSFSESMLDFMPLMNRWLSGHNRSFLRLAFGTELLFPVSNRRDGYEKLASLIPVQIDLEKSRDLSYQINRRRDSRLNIEGLEINRLSKWSVIKSNVGLQQGEIAFDLPGLERYAVRLELDINTVLEAQNDLRQEVLIPLYTELVELGVEIAEKGDIV